MQEECPCPCAAALLQTDSERCSSPLCMRQHPRPRPMRTAVTLRAVATSTCPPPCRHVHRRRVGMSTAPAGGPARHCAVHGFVVYSLRRRLRVVTKHVHLSRHSRDPRPASERRPRCGSANRQRPSGPAGITQVPVSRALVMPAGSRQCCSARMCSTVGEHRQHAPCMQARS